MATLIYEEKPACVASDSPLKPIFESLWPQLRMTLDYGEGEVLDRLAFGDGKGSFGCDGVLVARDLVDIAINEDAQYCRLKVVQSLFPAKTGWAVNRQAACVGNAFQWAFAKLSSRGVVEGVVAKWLQPAPCSASEVDVEVLGATGRRLGSQTSPSSQRGSSVGLGPNRGPPSPRRLATAARSAPSGATGRGRAQHRQLSTTSTAGSAAGAESSDTGIMGLTDFAGLFVLWGAVTLLLLVVAGFNALTGHKMEKTGRRLIHQLSRSAIRTATRGRAPPVLPNLGSSESGPGHHTKDLAESGVDALQIQQQLVSTLRDALADVHKMQSDMQAQSKQTQARSRF